MSKISYFTPYLVWLIVTVLLVELELIDDRFRLLLYCVISLIISVSLEIIRNRILNNNVQMNKVRIVLYLCLNLILGIPLAIILVIVNLPLKVPVGFINDIDQGMLMSWQQYLFIGYVSIWFISNVLILKPANVMKTILLLLSLIILIISSLLSSQVFVWMKYFMNMSYKI